ncbi:PIN domain-containing protein [Pararhizobium arenae]|uniref:PIN domain-containing protein n=1 Tax=Pararhizobium arenae TaxID=1856850 RepID=UPI00094AE3BF|nr:PIN domain-containing protein [Pararhizobium arenae]
MSVPPLLDTNILVYAASSDIRASKAQLLLTQPFIVSVQAFNEFANVSRRKMGMSWQETRTAINDFSKLATVVLPVDTAIHTLGMELAERLKLSIFDAMMVASALRAGCSQCYSEDMQHGLVVNEQLRIVNPFIE